MVVYSGDIELDKKISEWLKWDRNDKTRAEINKFIECKDWSILRKRLQNRLAFGTAGLRGVMRAGFNSMNDLVIVQTAQGLCEYILKCFPKDVDRKERGVVFGYDGRYNSKRFADLSACIFVQRGIKVWRYSRMVATPFVPFAITQLKCLAGVMVTASHNPKEDNGYKVYWSNGPQIITPHDQNIQKTILQNLEPRECSWNTDILANNKLLADPYEKMFKGYYKSLMSIIPEEFIKVNAACKKSFVYTAMHGVGYPYVEEGFEQVKLSAKQDKLTLIPVAEQKDPDPDFPTVTFPNPEEGKSALELSIKKAEAVGVTTILANDPDADRLACAEKDPQTGKWKVFTGNELGALLGWWAIQTYLKQNPSETDLSNCYLLASTVSSKILRAFAKKHGCNFIETLTGFKWMGNRSDELLSEGKKVLFAFEEAIGFMFGTSVLDKDGVSAACHLATMASYLQSTRNISLIQKLDEIYDEYGYHCTNCSYLFCYDPKAIESIFTRLRHFQNGEPNTYPHSIHHGEFAIKNVRDLTTGLDNSQPDGRAILPVSSSSQMITFTFANDVVVTLRTSGTEPKIKYYAELCAQPGGEEDRQQLRDKLNRMVEAICEEFLQPKLNNLTAKAD